MSRLFESAMSRYPSRYPSRLVPGQALTVVLKMDSDMSVDLPQLAVQSPQISSWWS